MSNTFTSAEVFSPFEVDQFAIKMKDASAYERDDCVGSLNVERETRTVTKKCRGIVKKRRTKATGNGTVTVSMHIKLALIRAMTGMTNAGLQPGIYGYKNTENMPEFACVARVKDEDDNILFKAFPVCVMEELNVLDIKNGEEEVAEIEIKFNYQPDENGIGEYEALETELTGQILTGENWMTDFSPINATTGEDTDDTDDTE